MKNRIKKVLILLFVTIFAFGLVSCGQQTADDIISNAIQDAIKQSQDTLVLTSEPSTEGIMDFGTANTVGYVENENLKEFEIEDKEAIESYLYDLVSDLDSTEYYTCIATEYSAVIALSQVSFITTAFLLDQGDMELEDTYNQLVLGIRTLSYAYSESIAEEFENMDGYPVLIVMLNSYTPENIYAVVFDSELIYSAVEYSSENG